MADKDYSQLTSATTAADTDLIAVYPTGGPLKKMTWLVFITEVIASLGSSLLVAANNLSDVASASSARANLGLGSAALLAQAGVFQPSNNFSEVVSAATARTNIGAAASSAPTITGGMTYSGSTKQNVQAMGALDIDLSLGEWFTKSISANQTFTFSNPTASKAQGFILILTISSSAVPTWPASVDWPGGTAPTLGNGTSVLGFVTADGGTTWLGFVGGVAFA
jgi:hypothetical protein